MTHTVIVHRNCGWTQRPPVLLVWMGKLSAEVVPSRKCCRLRQFVAFEVRAAGGYLSYNRRSGSLAFCFSSRALLTDGETEELDQGGTSHGVPSHVRHDQASVCHCLRIGAHGGRGSSHTAQVKTDCVKRFQPKILQTTASTVKGLNGFKETATNNTEGSTPTGDRTNHQETPLGNKNQNMWRHKHMIRLLFVDCEFTPPSTGISTVLNVEMFPTSPIVLPRMLHLGRNIILLWCAPTPSLANRGVGYRIYRTTYLTNQFEEIVCERRLRHVHHRQNL